MSIATKKLELIDKLMRIGEEKTLVRVEELLVQAEMESRVDESMKDIANGDVVSIEEFTKGNIAWLRARDSR
tara:strand:+ start:318 stop:533 length:216 start_codon:yes stop_codon:yes gene_type:complete